MLKRMAATAAALAIAGGGMIATAGAAHATNVVYPCTKYAYGPMCFYYHSNYAGASVGIVSLDADEYDVSFEGGGDGSGQAVANNSGSGFNDDLVCTAHNYYHANYTGTELSFAPNTGSTTFGALNNGNRSLNWSC